MGEMQSPVRKRKVLVVDDHPIVRQGLSQLINAEPDLMVSAEAGDASGALASIAQTRPDIAVVDLCLEAEDGIQLLKTIRSMNDRLPVLILSMHDEATYAERALRAGANGYVMKQEATSKVLTAIRTVLKGEIFLSGRMERKLVEQFVRGSSEPLRPSIEKLSDRELQIFRLIGSGYGTRQIAEELTLSVKTIESYYAHIKVKMSLANVRELVQHAVEWVTLETVRQSGKTPEGMPGNPR